jgi:hypothetical protein
MYKWIFALTAPLLLSACSSVSVQDYAQRQPKLDPREFFDGKLCADGVVRDWKGEQIRQFNASILATWDEQGVGTLDEVFQFDDGRETRIWTLTPITNGDGQRAYRAKANDVPEPTVMNFAGNAIHMNYMLRYGEPGDTIDLTMDDWMFKVADGVVVNETTMSKWGFDVGQVLLVMRKVDEGHKCIAE